MVISLEQIFSAFCDGPDCNATIDIEVMVENSLSDTPINFPVGPGLGGHSSEIVTQLVLTPVVTRL